MNCAICFEEWKPFEKEYDEFEENFNCGTCNEGKICNKCYYKKSKDGEYCSWEYLITETAIERTEKFKRVGWTKQVIKGMECVVCRTPNWKQYYSSVIIKRTFQQEDGILSKLLLRAYKGLKIKPCFWVYLKNEHEARRDIFSEEEEKTYYEMVIQAYGFDFYDKHKNAFCKTLINIKNLRVFNCKEKFQFVNIINNKNGEFNSYYLLVKHRNNFYATLRQIKKLREFNCKGKFKKIIVINKNIRQFNLYYTFNKIY